MNTPIVDIDDEDSINNFINEKFVQKGIYFPACFPVLQNHETCLGFQSFDTKLILEAYLLEVAT